jgi:5-methyltetrahydrofolate--homocysteine methyltransferase
LRPGWTASPPSTFGANLGNLGEYGLESRIEELSETGARIARAAADAASAGRRPRWVLGSVGPGTKLPTLGHVRFADLRDVYQSNVTGLLRGGVDAIVVETARTCCRRRRRSSAPSGRWRRTATSR